MGDILKLYIAARSNSAQLVPLHAIIISILFDHYKEFEESLSEVEQIKKGEEKEARSIIKSKALYSLIAR